jgi:SAM-dependent methyltransferase
MSEAAVDAAIMALPLPTDPLVVDTGCGSGEVLLRTLRAYGSAHGLGVDLDPDAIAEARRHADGLPARFEVRDAATVEGRFDAVINVASSHAHGGFPGALAALRALGPVVMYGEGFWRRSPSADFLAALGGATVDELSDLDGLHAAIGEAGFDIVHESLATDRDWAHYEEMLAATAERNGTPATLAYARRIRERRALAGGTSTLGFALLILTRDAVLTLSDQLPAAGAANVCRTSSILAPSYWTQRELRRTASSFSARRAEARLSTSRSMWIAVSRPSANPQPATRRAAAVASPRPR